MRFKVINVLVNEFATAINVTDYSSSEIFKINPEELIMSLNIPPRKDIHN